MRDYDGGYLGGSNEKTITRRQTVRNVGSNVVGSGVNDRNGDVPPPGQTMNLTFGKKNKPSNVFFGKGGQNNNGDSGMTGRVPEDVLKNDSVLGILEKYGEIQLDGKGLKLGGGGTMDSGKVNNIGDQYLGDSMARGSIGLNEINDKNDQRMAQLNNFEKALGGKDEFKFDTKEFAGLLGLGAEGGMESYGGKGGGSGGQKLGDSEDFNLGTLDNLLEKYRHL
jgi:hypothetical protein